MKKIKQNSQINKSTTYDDTLAHGETLESSAQSLQDDQNALRSQIKRLAGTANWYDEPIGSVEYASKNRGVNFDFFTIVPDVLTTQTQTGIESLELETGSQSVVTDVTFANAYGLVGIHSGGALSDHGAGMLFSTDAVLRIGNVGHMYFAAQFSVTSNITTYGGIYTAYGNFNPDHGLYFKLISGQITLSSKNSGGTETTSGSPYSVNTTSLYRIKISWDGTSVVMTTWDAANPNTVLNTQTLTHTATSTAAMYFAYIARRTNATTGRFQLLDYIGYVPGI